jgi:hypothetical protein
MAYHHYFPKEFIDLQIEISYHPDLILQIMKASEWTYKNPFTGETQRTDWETAFLTKLAATCTYLNILVDGTYDERQLKELSTICTNRLMAQRKEWRVDHHE